MPDILDDLKQKAQIEDQLQKCFTLPPYDRTLTLLLSIAVNREGFRRYSPP